MGAPFNANGGGTFAAEWDPSEERIRTWFFPAGSEPADLKNGFPEPDSWGKPFSYFTLAPNICSADHFQNMRLAFTLNFCGDLGSAKFAESCPELAETMTCEEYVSGSNSKMAE